LRQPAGHVIQKGAHPLHGKNTEKMTSDTPQKPVPSAGGRLRAAAIVFITCVCGWMVMELEILGARVLAPYFGSALYVVMGSVIGVFLLSLSGGYLLGGWLSQLPASKPALRAGLVVAGAWLCAMPRAVQPLCDGLLDAGWDEKWGSLAAAMVLFGVPTVLLGTVSPTAVRWLTSRATQSGLNTGLVLAASTVASFAGCIVTAFYLLRLSAGRTIVTSGVILLALGAAILLHTALAGRVRGRGEGAG